MADFLLELLSEEIPARMQARAREDLERLFREQLAASALAPSSIETFATPRRLGLIARGLPEATEAVAEERRGPRADAPAQAIEGFLKSTGISREQLEEREDKKGGRVLFAVLEKAGRATSQVLAEAVPTVIRSFPWPKSMRWGGASSSSDSLRWVRPLQGIVALFGEEIVDVEVDGIVSGAATVGHRFHHPGAITIGSANDYAEKLRACHVIIDPAERQGIIRDGASAAAAAAGLSLVSDEGLVAENAGLTEWPMPLLGTFDPAFLEVPREVIQLTMRTNQKYFACTQADGLLAPAFVCVANVDAVDGGKAIVDGNRKVLAARLSDAKFFWEQDLKVPLESQAGKLEQIVFHEKLGTVAERVERIARLAHWLVAEEIVSGGDPDAAARAARLAKADLVTGMVGEFPELQGIIGGYLARAQGEDAAVADAVRDHYKPAGQGDEVPSAPLTIALSLADKADTIAQFFHHELRPSGSKDPFALRRAAIGLIQLIVDNRLRLSLQQLVQQAVGPNSSDTASTLLEFFADRLKVQQREAGVRHDIIDAVFSLGGEDDLVRLLARVKALQAFVETGEGADLLTGYKRAANILKREGWTGEGDARLAALETGEEDPFALAEDPAVADALVEYARQAAAKPADYVLEPEESALMAALDVAEAKAAAAVQAEDFEAAMAALAGLRSPVDTFFDAVTVNDPDPAKRESRLALLARMRDAVHQVADFSKIEG